MGKASRKKQERQNSGEKRYRFNPQHASVEYRELADRASFLEREARQTELYGPFLAERERQKEDTWGVDIRWEDENGELITEPDGTIPEPELLWSEDVWLSHYMAVSCVLRVSGYTEEELQVVQGMDDTEFGNTILEHATIYTMAGAWAESRTAYQYAPETWDAVVENFDQANLDGYVLDGPLPDWCPYVMFPEPIEGVRGFWVMHTNLESETDTESLALSIINDKVDGTFSQSTFDFTEGSLKSAVDEAIEEMKLHVDDPAEIEQQRTILESTVKATTFLVLSVEKGSVVQPLDTDFVWVPTLYREVIEEPSENRKKRDTHVKHRHVETWRIEAPKKVVADLFQSEGARHEINRVNDALPEGVFVAGTVDEDDFYFEGDEDDGPAISWEEWTSL